MAQLYDMRLEELRYYRPELTKENGFDAFWKETLSQLSKIKLDYRLIRYEYPVKGEKYIGFSIQAMRGQILKAGWQCPSSLANTLA